MNNKKKVVLLALLMVFSIFSAVELLTASSTTISSKGVATAEARPGVVIFMCNPVNTNVCTITIDYQQ